MDHSAIVDELIRLLHKTLEEERDVNGATALVSDAGLESIQVIEYLCEVEDRFDLMIDEETLSDVKTIDDLATVVARLAD